MNKKKLVIIFWDLGIGGIQKRIRDITLEISKKHPDWSIYILLRNKKEESFMNQITHVNNINILFYPFGKNYIRLPLGFIYWIFFMYVQLRADIILTFLPPLSVIVLIIHKLLFFIPTKVIVNDGVYITTYLKFRNQEWIKPLITLTYRFAYKIIVPTNACNQVLQKTFSIPCENINVIPNWTLIKKTKKMQPIYDLLYIGRFEKEKNVLSIVEITKNISLVFPNIQVLLVGSGSQYSNLQTLIKNENLTANIFLHQFDSNIGNFLRRSSILVFPSFSEGMPNVVLESAMYQLPTVTMNFPGVEDVVLNEETGYICKTSEEMSKRIIYLLKNGSTRNKMGTSAQRFVESNFHTETQKRFVKTILE